MTTADEFRRRAGFEALRYGGDAWVFVRELVQNARDAGAGRVTISVERRDGRDRFVCRDDGCGMTFEHARRYLFALYASSKTGREDNAGRFGIGFWSVLRFEPDVVIVRSAPRTGGAWEVLLSGDLEHVERSESAVVGGTEIELQRVAGRDDVAARVWDAVRRDARFLLRRGADDQVLEIRVNSRLATAELELPPPSLAFSRPGLRGVVALADEPRVELLAHGLRVRSAATLDELLTEPDRRRGPQKKPMPDGLLPQVILDSRRLRVLMARGDARTDRELRRLVALGRRGVRRLVRDQLDRQTGLGVFGRALARFRDLLSTRRTRWIAAGGAALAAVATGLFLMDGAVRPPSEVTAVEGGLGLSFGPTPEGLLAGDLAARYGGAATDDVDRRPVEVALRYHPPSEDPMLAVFRVSAMNDEGGIVPQPDSRLPAPYPGAACRHSCLDFELDLDVPAGWVRLPVPTGHLLDPASLRLSGIESGVATAPDGGPILVLERPFRGRVGYSTGPGVEGPPVDGGSWPALPPEAASLAGRLQTETSDRAARVTTEWVRQRVRYDVSKATVDRHRQAASAGLGFADRCLAVGAGDCDVQNALVASIMSRAGVPVRLAVGWVGSGGEARPGLHAWVEYLAGDGAWRVADASVGSSIGGEISGSALAVEAEQRTDRARPDRASAPPRRSRWSPAGWRLPLIAAFVLAGAVALVVRRRAAGFRFGGGGEPDLPGLLRGALNRPDAFAEVPALFSRRLVPRVGGSATTLVSARRLADRGRLTAGSRSSNLARRAAAAGVPPIDTDRPEGAAVARVLGAVDLDRWSSLLERGDGNPVAARLTSAASAAGERWTVVVGVWRSGEASVLDGRLAGFGRRCRLVAIDEGGPLWRRVRRIAGTGPAAAALVLAEGVLAHIHTSPGWKQRFLRGLAAAAVAERAGERA